MSASRVHLLLGSNIEPERNLAAAVRLLAGAVRLLRVGSAWQSDPVDRPEQPPFLNAAVLAETELDPAALKRDILLRIEERLGRRRDPADPCAARTIDIDIVLWEGLVGEILGRPVPDPDLLRRSHVATPLAEIDPDRTHPVVGLTLAEIARRLAPGGPALRRRADVRLDGGAAGERKEGRWHA